MVKVLFVCLGNICRSPTADGVMRQQLVAAGLQAQVEVDSAGTGDWHIGRAPDSRSQAAAQQRGYDLSALRARQVAPADFAEFDYILAMDKSNLADLQGLKPAGYRGHLGLLLDFAEHSQRREVPDPYYGEGAGFEQVLDLVEDAVTGLLADIRQRHL